MDEPNYGSDLKIIRFWVSDDDHARMLIRLRHNKLATSQFFRAVIDGVIQQEPNLMAFIESYVLKHKLMSYKRFAESLKIKRKGKEVIEDYGLLEDSDKEDLFDLISKEFPEL